MMGTKGELSSCICKVNQMLTSVLWSKECNDMNQQREGVHHRG